jgi:hypothetical protein
MGAPAFGRATGHNVGRGDGFQTRSDLDDPNIVYAESQGGNFGRLDLRTGQRVNMRERLQQTTAPPPPAGAVAEAGAEAGRGGGGRGGGRGGGGRWHWDTPLFISPHSPRRVYVASEKVYRSEDRGDNWVAISEDLTRNLDPTKIPIMGKVWPTNSVAYNEATTVLSSITTLDESPLLEGLIYVGTHDGLVQVTEDGGKTWRKIEKIPGLPDTRSSPTCSPRLAT